jgi:mannose-6-phosphate isomerase
MLYPLTFKPIYKDYLWGGTQIFEHYGREHAGSICAESWEISERPEGNSIVLNGPLAGKTLGELSRCYGQGLIGRETAHFPLLLKLIDAKQALSVQTHPGRQAASLFGGQEKSEMWYILGAEPASVVYAGFREGVTRHMAEEAIRQHQIEKLLNRIPVAAGDVIHIPGGRVHAIGSGCLLLEVQQNSNTTYRLYDWDRLDASGNPRELHVEQALNCIDWENRQPSKIIPAKHDCGNRPSEQILLKNEHFIISRLELREPVRTATRADSFEVVFVEHGSLTLEGPRELRLNSGQVALIPAALRDGRIIPDEPGTVFLSVLLPPTAP